MNEVLFWVHITVDTVIFLFQLFIILPDLWCVFGRFTL